MACVFLHSQLLQKPRPWLRVQFHTWIRRWFQPAVFSPQGAGRSCLPRSPGASGSLVALDNHLSLVQSLPRRSQRGQPGPASRCPDQAIPLGKTPRQPLCCQSSVTSCFTGSFLKHLWLLLGDSSRWAHLCLCLLPAYVTRLALLLPNLCRHFISYMS